MLLAFKPMLHEILDYIPASFLKRFGLPIAVFEEYYCTFIYFRISWASSNYCTCHTCEHLYKQLFSQQILLNTTWIRQQNRQRSASFRLQPSAVTKFTIFTDFYVLLTNAHWWQNVETDGSRGNGNFNAWKSAKEKL
jgi:hypothetical protein